jgi:hypothetical protein
LVTTSAELKPPAVKAVKTSEPVSENERSTPGV